MIDKLSSRPPWIGNLCWTSCWLVDSSLCLVGVPIFWLLLHHEVDCHDVVRPTILHNKVPCCYCLSQKRSSSRRAVGRTSCPVDIGSHLYHANHPRCWVCFRKQGPWNWCMAIDCFLCFQTPGFSLQTSQGWPTSAECIRWLRQSTLSLLARSSYFAKLFRLCSHTYMFGHAAGTLKKTSFLPLLYAGWQESFCSKIDLTWAFAPSYHVIPSRELTCPKKIGKEIHLPNCLWMEYVSSQGIHPEDAWVVSGCMSHTHPTGMTRSSRQVKDFNDEFRSLDKASKMSGSCFRGTWDTVDGRNPANQL